MKFYSITMATVVMCLTLAMVNDATAQRRTPRSVAIYLYEGVELLDFAGPGEAFSSAGFTVYTMSVDGKELTSQGFVKIKPQYSIENAPAPDIVVFPGGHSTPTANDKKVLDWIKQRKASGTFLMSVCTGAEILAKAEMLNGLTVTTFYGFIPGLRMMLPDSKVVEHTRFVDNGTIITTAGVSAGIDGALHLVARTRGMDIAKEAARYMEYDKWNPADGRVEHKNAIIEKLRAETTKPEKEIKSLLANVGSDPEEAPYEGELKNLVFEFRDKGMYQQATNILEATIKLYPARSNSYTTLAELYVKLGKPTPTTEAVFIKMLDDGKVDEALSVYEKDLRNFPEWKLIGENPVNDAAYRIMQKGDLANAIKVFEMNVKAFPKSANVFDSLGEAYMVAGKKPEAIANYKKSLELNPQNDNAKAMLNKLGI